MTILSAAIFQIDLVIKNYATDFYLDVIADQSGSTDPIMKIGELQLAGKGIHFIISWLIRSIPEWLVSLRTLFDNKASISDLGL